MTSSQSAVGTLFATPELLEEILSHLSIDRLIILKRVSWHWNTVISTSPHLQRILFQRADPARATRIHNPLFEDYFSDISCVDKPALSPSATSPSTSSASTTSTTSGAQITQTTAHLKISPTKVRQLLHHCPKSWRAMHMFQPPCRYYLSMPSTDVFAVNVRFVNEPGVPVMQAVERASLIQELEADKKRNLRRNLERELKGVRERQRAAMRVGG